MGGAKGEAAHGPGPRTVTPPREEPVGRRLRQALKAVPVGTFDWNIRTGEMRIDDVGNVVRHAKGPAQLRLLRSTGLICEVSDKSLTTPRIRRASEMDEGGRGLQLIAALSHRRGTRYTAGGKCIWTEQSLCGGSDGALKW